MSNELTKATESQVPAYLQNQEVLGKDELSRYVQPSRLKICQKMSKAPFDQFNPGTLLVVPQMQVFAEMERGATEGAEFKFVPLLFYVEWIQTNPLGMNPFVRQRTFDPQSELAKKAMNSDTWFEQHPDNPEKEVANRECLNYILMPYGDSPFAGTPVAVTFSKANYKDGTNLSTMINARPTSIFTQVFTGKASQRSNDKGDWFGMNFNIPTDTPYVTEEEFPVYKELFEKLKEIQERGGGIQVDYEDPAADEEVNTSKF